MNTINKSIKMKTRTLIIAMALAALPLFTFAQSVFDKFEDMDDVTVVVINKQMFNLMGKIGADSAEADEYISLVSSLDNLKVFATENASIASDMKSKVNSYLKSAKLTELMRVKDKDANVKIYIKEGKNKDHVSELFMFVYGIKIDNEGGRNPEAVIVSITGDINLNEISKLTKEMNIPGGEHLNKAGKKN